MSEQDNKAAKREAPAVVTTKRPLIIVNTTPGQIDFPVGKYSKVTDARGSVGHSIKLIRISAGLNFTDRCVLGQKRHDLTDEEYELLAEHPDYKRLRDAKHIREYKSVGAIEANERAKIIEISADVSHLGRWKADADKPTKLAIDARLQELSDEGLSDDVRNVPDHIHRPGQAVVM